MRRARVTVTLSPDVLSKVDRAARSRPGGSRSSVIEAWLRRAAEGEAQGALDQAIARYYDGVTAEEHAESKAWARFGTRSFMVREGRSKTSYAPGSKNRKRK
jgi:metal-responsive CopG/Arc/MetJ family transcriptional regulator